MQVKDREPDYSPCIKGSKQYKQAEAARGEMLKHLSERQYRSHNCRINGKGK